MARVVRKGAVQRPRQRLSLLLLVAGLVVFLVVMLPSEKPQPRAEPQLSKTLEQGPPQQAQEPSEGSVAEDAAAGEAAASTEQPQEQPEGGGHPGTGGTDGEQAGEAAQGAEGAAGSTAVGTGVFYEVPAENEGDPPTRAELLEEPVPEDCFMEEHADYEGPALTWGLTYKLPSAAQCCQACKDRREPGADGMYCNVWVWCGSRTGECWSQDIWNHTTGECWLKYQKDWDNRVDRAATNLQVNRRGKYPPDFREEHTTAPEEVAWTAGVIPAQSAA